MQRGLSLLELIIVLAILAVLLAMGYNTYRPAQHRALARQALVAIAATLREGRSLAQRLNVGAVFSWSDAQRYELTVKNRTTGEVHRQYSRSVAPLEAAIKTSSSGAWRTPGPGDKLSYEPPFGETGVTPLAIRVRFPGDPSAEACLKVIGVTGKVVIARACP